MSKEEMTAEYYQQLKELNFIKLQYKERATVQNHMNCCLVVLAASGYPDACPKTFAWLKAMCDKENKKMKDIDRDIQYTENEMVMTAYWISMLND